MIVKVRRNKDERLAYGDWRIGNRWMYLFRDARTWLQSLGVPRKFLISDKRGELKGARGVTTASLYRHHVCRDGIREVFGRIPKTIYIQFEEEKPRAKKKRK